MQMTSPTAEQTELLQNMHCARPKLCSHLLLSDLFARAGLGSDVIFRYVGAYDAEERAMHQQQGAGKPSQKIPLLYRWASGTRMCLPNVASRLVQLANAWTELRAWRPRTQTEALVVKKLRTTTRLSWIFCNASSASSQLTLASNPLTQSTPKKAQARHQAFS